MTFEQKKERAIAIMVNKKMWRSNYAPPLLRGLWRLGLKIPPFPFASFWLITGIMGCWFGPVWGLWMWFSTWKNTGMSPAVAAFMSILSGFMFGMLLGVFHMWRKKVNRLPDWKDL